MNTPRQLLCATVLVPSLLLGAAFAAHAQSQRTEEAAPRAVTKAELKAPSEYNAVRATAVIDKNVNGADEKSVGKILDLVIDLTTGKVRYAMLEFDPGMLKGEKIFAVPLRELAFAGADRPLVYKTMSRDVLENAGIDKKDWKRALDNRRYLEGLDRHYGFTPPRGKARSMLASELLGKDVKSRAGKDIGDLKELVLDMSAGRVHYAVLAFDPSWLAGEKLYAFKMSEFKLAQVKGRDGDLTLDVDKSMIDSMKDFDAKRWSNLNDADREAFINTVPNKARR